jgi:two-component system, cell cycle response regulator DivK
MLGKKGLPNLHSMPFDKLRATGLYAERRCDPMQPILIVEDDERSRRLLSDVLVFHGYTVLQAATGNEALSLAQEHNPALVLLDIQLPDISGFEVLTRLRALSQFAKTPAAAVTASVMDYDRKRIREAGFDAYIAKPINIDGLIAEVRALLAGETNLFLKCPRYD